MTWLGFLWMAGMPSGFAFVAAWFYSRVVLRGIASARDEHHRMTPQSPWFFFDREFKRPVRRIAVFLAPWSLGAMSATWWEETIRYARGDWEQRLTLLLIYCAMYGLACYAGAGITLLAPRIRNPTALASAGTWVGFLLWSALLQLIVWRGGGDAETHVPLGVFAGLGMFGWFLAGIYVRRKLDVAWFKFDG